METKHTPGPWYPVQYAGFWHIQTEDYYTDSDVLNEDHFNEAESNAKLCASAPDLLSENAKLKESNRELVEALEGLANIKEEILAHLDFCREGLSEQYLHYFENADQLIQKAKGGE